MNALDFELDILKAVLFLFVVVIVIACVIAITNGQGLTAVPSILSSLFQTARGLLNH